MELKVHGKVVRATTGGRPLDAAAPLVVFLHGAGQDRTVWASQTRYFAAHGRAVLAVDLPGHGGSAGPAFDSVEALAAWTIDLIAAGGWRRAALVGHSLGALVALEAAAAGADAVSHLALLAGAAAMPVSPALLDASRDDPPRAWDMVMEWGLSPGSHLGGHPTPGLWTHGAGWKIMAAGREGSLYADFTAATRYEGGNDAARQISCPTLLIHGERDRMVRPAAAHRLAETIAGSQMVTLPGIGHFPMLESPDDVLDALIGLLAPRGA